MADRAQAELLEQHKIANGSSTSDSHRNPMDHWTRIRQIGAGAFGVVYLQNNLATGRVRAVKEVRKKTKLNNAELFALAYFSKPAYEDYFVRFFGWYEDELSIFITMEYLEHGDLRFHMQSALPETQGRLISLQLFSALSVLHREGFVHRDINPSNILVVRKQPFWHIKIADFAASKCYEPDSPPSTEIGTRNYTAPEVLGILDDQDFTIYDNKVDIWGAGVIIYEILCHRTPFSHIRPLILYCSAQEAFPDEGLNQFHVSEPARRLLHLLLAVVSETRPTAEEALRSDWFRTELPDNTQEIPTIPEGDTISETSSIRSNLSMHTGPLNPQPLPVPAGDSISETASNPSIWSADDSLQSNLSDDSQTVDSQPVDSQPLDSQPLDEQPLDEQPLDEQPLVEQPLDEQPLDEQPRTALEGDLISDTASNPSIWSDDSQTVDSQPLDGQPLDEQPRTALEGVVRSETASNLSIFSEGSHHSILSDGPQRVDLQPSNKQLNTQPPNPQTPRTHPLNYPSPLTYTQTESNKAFPPPRHASSRTLETKPAHQSSLLETDNSFITHSSYTVGWICATPIELAAAVRMLDWKYERLGQSHRDHNSYVLGRIGYHDVAITCLPDMGNVSAAIVAEHMTTTFPAIKFVLMVGVGGGVPSSAHDIRLGDVVVGYPIGPNAGVMQYRSGRMRQGRIFEYTGFMNRPPKLIMNAVNHLRADHLNGDAEISRIVNDAVAKFPKTRARWSHPGENRDVLFRPDYTHVDENDLKCENCDKARILTREPRDSVDPEIFYGLIASGDLLMRDSSLRDELRDEYGVLCFEMEAAGLMNHFPCLVIRGISDYCDSHKNKIWQPFAAVTAAAYARELLTYVPWEWTKRLAPASEII